ncbi:hypothetical protein D9757_002577 [Collybiopsis confluens]|uniref:MARVEL domain-containing protein n=1 Tax=Collybiopsis confluens TaxID=2823264 RepID=A0A8H5HW80_9AGAR|nr:hypothetical protein D9757_002577 [Collybiopsis confluens]
MSSPTCSAAIKPLHLRNEPLRLGLYFALALFSIILLGLTAARINYTLGLAVGFYDPIVVELLVSSIIAIIWSFFIMHIIHTIRVGGPVTTFRHESIGFIIIWIMFLVGAAIATNFWANLSVCFGTFTCDILTAIVAFSWLNFITLTLIGIFSMLFLAGNSGYGSMDEPLHGRWGSGRKLLFELSFTDSPPRWHFCPLNTLQRFLYESIVLLECMPS